MFQQFRLKLTISLMVLGLMFPYHIALADFKVAESELKASDPIEFQNYQGPRPSYMDSPDTVRGIGSYLAGDLDSNQMDYNGKYSIQKVRDTENAKMFSADIMSITNNARLNTIRNMRRIITGYLQSAYNYSYQDAYLLSIFTTYYNVLIRNNKNLFTDRYSPQVLGNIDENKAGLDVNYTQWAGNTQMIIPVVDDTLGGGIDAFELGNKDVNESLRQEDGKGIPEREALANVQENQLQQEKQALQDSKDKNEAKEIQLNQEREKLEGDLKNAQTPEQRQEIQKSIQENEQQQQAVQKEKENLNEQEKVVEDHQEQLKQNQNTLNEDKKAQAQAPSAKPAAPAANNQAKPAPAPAPAPSPEATQKKVENLEQQVQQQQTQLDRNEKIEGDLFYYLERINYFNGKNKDSVLIMVDPIKRTILKRSPLRTISGNRFDIFDQGIILVARENPKSEVNHLTLLNKNTLEISKVGAENIYADGMVRVDGDKIYAIFEKEDGFYLGRFNQNLELAATSSIAVNKETFLSFHQGKAYLADENGAMIILDAETLALDDNGRIAD